MGKNKRHGEPKTDAPGQVMTNIPQSVAELVEVLTAMPGTIAVVLGGSHAIGTADGGSDWDFGLYYRGTIEPCSIVFLAV